MTLARKARKAVGLTLEEAARQAGLSVSTVRRMETLGGGSYAHAVRLSRVYRTSANVFLTGLSEGKSGSTGSGNLREKKSTPAA